MKLILPLVALTLCSSTICMEQEYPHLERQKNCDIIPSISSIDKGITAFENQLNDIENRTLPLPPIREILGEYFLQNTRHILPQTNVQPTQQFIAKKTDSITTITQSIQAVPLNPWLMHNHRINKEFVFNKKNNTILIFDTTSGTLLNTLPIHDEQWLTFHYSAQSDNLIGVTPEHIFVYLHVSQPSKESYPMNFSRTNAYREKDIAASGCTINGQDIIASINDKRQIIFRYYAPTVIPNMKIIQSLHKFSLPKEYVPTCIALTDTKLFIGGRNLSSGLFPGFCKSYNIIVPSRRKTTLTEQELDTNHLALVPTGITADWDNNARCFNDKALIYSSDYVLFDEKKFLLTSHDNFNYEIAVNKQHLLIRVSQTNSPALFQFVGRETLQKCTHMVVCKNVLAVVNKGCVLFYKLPKFHLTYPITKETACPSTAKIIDWYQKTEVSGKTIAYIFPILNCQRPTFGWVDINGTSGILFT